MTKLLYLPVEPFFFYMYVIMTVRRLLQLQAGFITTLVYSEGIPNCVLHFLLDFLRDLLPGSLPESLPRSLHRHRGQRV